MNASRETVTRNGHCPFEPSADSDRYRSLSDRSEIAFCHCVLPQNHADLTAAVTVSDSISQLAQLFDYLLRDLVIRAQGTCNRNLRAIGHCNALAGAA